MLSRVRTGRCFRFSETNITIGALTNQPKPRRLRNHRERGDQPPVLSAGSAAPMETGRPSLRGCRSRCSSSVQPSFSGPVGSQPYPARSFRRKRFEERGAPGFSRPARNDGSRAEPQRPGKRNGLGDLEGRYARDCWLASRAIRAPSVPGVCRQPSQSASLRDASTGTIAVTPSSVAFSTIHSKRSNLMRAATYSSNRVRMVRGAAVSRCVEIDFSCALCRSRPDKRRRLSEIS